jgi:hypothetical protein
VLVFFSAHHILWLSFPFFFVIIPANIFVQQQPVDFRTAAIEVRPIGNFSFCRTGARAILEVFEPANKEPYPWNGPHLSTKRSI